MKIHLDFETFSRADIKEVGAYRYACDPSTRILIAAVAVDDGRPFAWVHPEHESDLVQSDVRALEVFSMWEDPNVEVYAHNASFEHAVSTFRFMQDVGMRPPSIDRWRCSAVMCRKAGIPYSLEKSSIYLACANQKDSAGDKLIKVFSTPQKKGEQIYGTEQPEKFKAFVDYCKQDVRVERDVEKALKPFMLTGAVLDAFHFDLGMNLRGIPVNIPALENAHALIVEESGRLTKRFSEITGLTPSQNVKVLQWFKQYRYPGDGMGADVVEAALDRLDDWCENEEVEEALKLRQEIGFAAVNKVEKMLECNYEGFVMGCFMFNGAGTGRWSAKLIQPQNFKRPSESLRGHTFEAFDLIVEGTTLEELSLLFGQPLEVISSCIRHFIGYQGQTEIYSADYSSIEARIVCWLAGQEDALERFRNKVDSYVHMASKIWPDQDEGLFTKDSFERFVGKQAVLGCGFQMGPPKFQVTCAKYGETLNMGLCELTVAEFRRTYDKVEKLWKACERAARAAILNPGMTYDAGPKLTFRVTNIAGKKFLIFGLPSGRKLAYPEPAIEPGGFGDQITFYGQIPFKQTWGRVSTYGAKLVENATQGTAFDVMAAGAVNAEREGFEIFALIHDEALAPAVGRTDEERRKNLDKLLKVLTGLPEWADGLPIEAEGNLLPFYTK